MKHFIILLTTVLLLVPMIAGAQIKMCISYWEFDDCTVDPDHPTEPPGWCGYTNLITTPVNAVVDLLNGILEPLNTWAE